MSNEYETLKLKNQLCFPLYLCAKEVTHRYGEFLDELDLTYTQYVVMMYLWEIGEGSVKALGDALMIDPSTLTPLLKKLESKGYITRNRSETDERSLMIRLTDEGDALKEKAVIVPQKMKQCVGLTEEEGMTLCRLLTKVLTNIEKE